MWYFESVLGLDLQFKKMEGIEKVVGDLYIQYQPILRDTAELLNNKGIIFNCQSNYI